MRGGRQGYEEGHVKRLLVVAMAVGSGFLTGAARAQKPPLLPEKDVAALTDFTRRRNWWPSGCGRMD
jgi:hypothetical protein